MRRWATTRWTLTQRAAAVGTVALSTTALSLFLPATKVCAEPAAPKVVVALFDDLIPQENIARARTALSKLVELVGRQVNHPTELIIIPGGNQQAIIRAAQRVERGEIHLMAVTSLEYVWWSNLPHGQPEILVQCDPGGTVKQYEEVIVRRDGKIQDVADLRGASFAKYRSMPLTVPIYLKLLRAKSGGVLEGAQVEVNHSAAALHAVFDGEVDATIVDVYATLRFQKAFTGRMDQLRVLHRSSAYPLPVVVGNRALIERQRPGLWKDLQTTLKTIKHHPDAVAYLEIWQQRGFDAAPPDFEQAATAAAADYPFSELPVGR